MISTFDKQNLHKLLIDFYNVVGIRISIFDEDFNIVTEYPNTSPRLCSMIRESEEGRKACHSCDIAACKLAKKLREPHIYQCHVGVTEAVTPIKLGGGILGYAILAHMLPKENHNEAIAQICIKCSKYDIKKEDLLSAAKEIKTHNKEKIMSCVKILDAVASYLYISQLVRWENEDISKQLDKYIYENLTLDLNSNSLCKHFLISRTKLYQISIKSFGMGISQYITFKRVEKAKELLSAKMSVTDVSSAVGYCEYNYFCKIFKKQTGVSPSKYSRLNKKEP